MASLAMYHYCLRRLMANRITICCGSFCTCAITSVLWPALPSYPIQFGIGIAAIIFAAFGYVMTRKAPTFNVRGHLYSEHCATLSFAMSGALAGTLWVASVGYSYLSWQLPEDKIQQDVTLFGQVVAGGCLNSVKSDGELSGDGQKKPVLTLRVSRIDSLKLNASVDMRLYALDPQLCVHTNDKVTFTARIKPAYGNANPVGFSQQRYLTSQHIVATGYIKTNAKQAFTENRISHHHGLRFYLSESLSDLALVNNAWFQALLLGNKQALSNEDWMLIQRTGTAHVFSISGMHLGIIAGAVLLMTRALFLLVVRLFGQRIVLSNTRDANLCLVVIATLLYAYVSGLSLPVVRAFSMLVIGCAMVWSRLATTRSALLVFMLFFCVVLFPLSWLHASFYLSIGAVFIIIFLNWRFQLFQLPWYYSIIVLQVALSIFMVPITLLWFGQASLTGIVANLVLVPLISLLLPIAIALFIIAACCDTLLPSAAGWAMQGMWLLDDAFSQLLRFLRFLSDWPHSAFLVSFEPQVMMALCFALIIAILPTFYGQKRGILSCLFPFIFAISTPYNPARWYVHVFDAGQGTAIALTRGHRAGIIDTGPVYQGKAPIAESVIPQYLAQINANDVDFVVVSHSDTDHAGGVDALSTWLSQTMTNKALPRAQSGPTQWFSPLNGCTQGEAFEWQGLIVSFHWPQAGNHVNSNNTSCVVSISDGHYRILLPGDIEREAEYALIKTTQLPSANVLIAPHHGSKTSSTQAFITSVSPQYVIYTQGYENRWQFPSKKVYQRYEAFGARQFTTSEFGYIRLEFSSKGIIVEPTRSGSTKRWFMVNKPPRYLQD